MDRSKKPNRKRSDPLPEPEYFDELFPPAEDMPDPWSETEDPVKRKVAEKTGSLAETAGKGSDQQSADDSLSRVAKEKPEPAPSARAGKFKEDNPPQEEPSPRQGHPTHGKRSPAGLPNAASVARPPSRPKYRKPNPNPRSLIEAKQERSETLSPAEAPTRAARPRVAIPPPKVGVRAEARPASSPEHPTASKPDGKLDWPVVSKAGNSEGPDSKPQWYVLEEVIQDHRPLPENAVILGVGEDGKPLVLSLEEPSPGGILILGDSSRDNRKHLQAILHSVSLLNQKDNVRVDVVSPETANYKKGESFIDKVCSTSEDAVYELLGDYLEALEKRGLRDTPYPIRILVLDEIDTLAARLAPESLSYLRWILRRGPQVGIWPIASLASGRLTDFDLKTYRSFGLRLCGKITEAEIAERYSNISGQLLKKLLPGSQACLKVEDEVITFSIPHF